MKQTSLNLLLRFKSAVALAFIFGILLSVKLWLSDRLYPLTPVFNLLGPFPNSLDKIILIALCALLIWTAISKRPIVIALAVTFCGILFLQDQSRLYPSFYEYFILLFLLATFSKNQTEENAERVLGLCKFTVASIYVWSGISKLNPYFVKNVFPWLISPLHLPLYPLLPNFFGFTAAFCEISLGICLLIPRFQKSALRDLLIMHGFLFFLIGPFRHDWNDAAWAWNIASAVFLFLLFRDTHKFAFRELLYPFSKTVFTIVVLVGFLPALNMVNIWDSALSFNVYSGNTDEAVISMNAVAHSRINREAQQAAYPESEDKYDVYLDLWNNIEFNAGSYPELRIFKNVFKTLCLETGQDPSLRLLVTKKAQPFKWQQVEATFLCDSTAVKT